jgi:carboxyl-terminal processing protease
MRRACIRSGSWLVLPFLFGPFSAPGAEPAPAAAKAPPEIAAKVMEVTDAVLRHHIDPPTRQEMILQGIKAVHEAAGVPAPAGLGRRISVLATAEEFAALIDATWPRLAGSKPKAADPDALTEALLDGLLRPVSGGARLVPGKEAKIQEQFQSNLYVGIQIALSYNGDEKRTQVVQIFEGGPAQRAGMLKGDLFEKVDGVDVSAMQTTGVVQRLRGEEGTDVEVAVRQPKTSAVRTLRMTRSKLMRPTISGLRKRPSGGWDFRIDGPEPIAYVKIDTITGSTPHELRQVARQLESEGIRAVVLDLRPAGLNPLHPTVLLADALLERGTIGQVRTAERVQTYEADADALFRGWPLAVLIGGMTRGPAEWLAAALQDNHRAVLVGEPTPGVAAVENYVPVLDGAWALEMTTQRLERGDGRPIGDPQARVLPLQHRNVNANTIPHRGPHGVKPDQAVATPKPQRVPGRPVARPAAVKAASAPAIDVPRKDPVLTRAVDVLREALKNRPEAGD